jgi:3-oxoacyl-[acyl-carrier-protein] synthase II
MDKRRVVVTGLGVIAPNGCGTETFWRATVQGISGVKSISTFDTSDYSSRIAGEIRDFDPAVHLPADTGRRLDRYSQFGLAASCMAVDDSAGLLDAYGRDRIGCIMGSGVGGVLYHEQQLQVLNDAGPRRVNPFSVPRITANAVTGHIAMLHGVTGPNLTVSTACASGSHAVGEALRKIQYGEADAMLAGGAEAPLSPGTVAAFCVMRALSSRNDEPETACRPFDATRDGFVIAEGSAVLVLEELEQARARHAPIYAEVVGYGLTSGAYDMVRPEPTGRDAAAAMSLALRDAGLAPDEVDYINAHGTATTPNDLTETLAIKQALGDAAWTTPISSTKSCLGHAIGAAGAIEAVVCCLAIRDGLIPPTINHHEPDPECDLDYVPNTARPATVNVALSNSFGFGSVNACLAFRRCAAD